MVKAEVTETQGSYVTEIARKEEFKSVLFDSSVPYLFMYAGV